MTNVSVISEVVPLIHTYNYNERYEPVEKLMETGSFGAQVFLVYDHQREIMYILIN